LVPSTGVTVKVFPVQIEDVIADIAGVGLTVTVTVNVDPVQVAVAGVTVYVAVAMLLVAFERVPVMTEPLPAAPPVNPVPAGAFQV
jgi:hypothetical protein